METTVALVATGSYLGKSRGLNLTSAQTPITTKVMFRQIGHKAGSRLA
jgi:hypothetical protein